MARDDWSRGAPQNAGWVMPEELDTAPTVLMRRGAAAAGRTFCCVEKLGHDPMEQAAKATAAAVAAFLRFIAVRRAGSCRLPLSGGPLPRAPAHHVP
jgi:hypothetical protein